MLNAIWLMLVIGAVVIGLIEGRTTAVVASVTDSCQVAITLIIGMVGLMSFWLGLLKIAEEAGLVRFLAKLLRPLMLWLFPDVPGDHPAMGSMVLNIAANMLGLSNAATPFGLRAMAELETLNDKPGTATNAMCTFLALNTSSVQLIPVTAIALLAAGRASDPTAIIFTSLLATSCSTIAAIISVKSFQYLPFFNRSTPREASCPTP